MYLYIQVICCFTSYNDNTTFFCAHHCDASRVHRCRSCVWSVWEVEQEMVLPWRSWKMRTNAAGETAKPKGTRKGDVGVGERFLGVAINVGWNVWTVETVMEAEGFGRFLGGGAFFNLFLYLYFCKTSVFEWIKTFYIRSLSMYWMLWFGF